MNVRRPRRALSSSKSCEAQPSALQLAPICCHGGWAVILSRPCHDLPLAHSAVAAVAFVENLWFYSGLDPDHSKEKLLPDAAVELIIDLTDWPKNFTKPAICASRRRTGDAGFQACTAASLLSVRRREAR